MSKRILTSLSIVGVMAAIVIGGTIAYFSDMVVSEGNTFTTGNADLKIKSTDLENCDTWKDSCPGKIWEDLYPGWSDSYKIWLKNQSASPITLKVIPYIEETGSSQDLWNNTYMEITWADGSHSTGRYSLEEWKTNSTIELEPRLKQNKSAGPWIVKFDIPKEVGNEIANSSISFNLVFNGVQVEEGEEYECVDNSDCDDNNPCTQDICQDYHCQHINYGSEHQCSDTPKCSAGEGDNNYGTGGDYLCRGYCDGEGNCDYAKDCQKCQAANALATCQSDECVITSCNFGYADCDHTFSNGCETLLDNNYGSCSTSPSLGEICGDGSCQSASYSSMGIGEAWYKVYIKECSNQLHSLKIRATLDVPSEIDYDLYLYSPCGTMLASSENGAGVDESIEYTISDQWGSDDSRWFYLEVRYNSGSSCGYWTLKTYGGDCF